MLKNFNSLLSNHPLVAAVPLLAGAAFLAVLGWPESEARDIAPEPQAELHLVRTTTVRAELIGESYSAIGEIRPRQESDFGFRVSGKLVERLVDVGATVEKGALLARIEDQDYRNRLLSAKADRAAAEAVFVEAEAAEARSSALIVKGFTTRANHQLAVKNLRSAEAKLDSAKVAYAMAEDQLRYTELRADFSGVVTEVMAEPGQIVNVGQMILRIADPSEKDAVFSIAESAFAHPPEPGETPKITVSLLSNPNVAVTGTVREIAPVADDTTRTYKVKVALMDAGDEMRFGASVSGRVERMTKPVMVLPGSALFDRAGAPAVWVVEKGSEVRLKPVTVARYETDRIIVSDGLAQGDIVVTAGVNRLRENQKVRLQEK
ncbi:efflux RND transporter periplasmic adaptor subunit [Taklimakanibacter deserti]|uniref:efflux RND transporter periplasmic adaptor subunit n=1 Tax=Taklimakanibacter deserti TaxID=2267839 RepID=UPI000E64DF84